VSGGQPAWSLPTVAARRVPLIVEITKGSPNFTAQTIQVDIAAGAAPTDGIPFDALIAAMESPTLAAAIDILNAIVAASAYALASAQSLAVDESANGDLNAICISWNRSFIPINWSEFLWAKWA
jgi:hypothetical protein